MSLHNVQSIKQTCFVFIFLFFFSIFSTPWLARWNRFWFEWWTDQQFIFKQVRLLDQIYQPTISFSFSISLTFCFLLFKCYFSFFSFFLSLFPIEYNWRSFVYFVYISYFLPLSLSSNTCSDSFLSLSSALTVLKQEIPSPSGREQTKKVSKGSQQSHNKVRSFLHWKETMWKIYCEMDWTNNGKYQLIFFIISISFRYFAGTKRR